MLQSRGLLGGVVVSRRGPTTLPVSHQVQKRHMSDAFTIAGRRRYMKQVSMLYLALYGSYNWHRKRELRSGRLEILTENCIYSPIQMCCVLSSVFPKVWATWRQKTMSATERDEGEHSERVSLHPNLTMNQKIWFDYDPLNDADWRWTDEHGSFFANSAFHSINVESENLALNAPCEQGHKLSSAARRSIKKWLGDCSEKMFDCTPLLNDGPIENTSRRKRTRRAKPLPRPLPKKPTREYAENVRLVFGNHLNCTVDTTQVFEKDEDHPGWLRVKEGVSVKYGRKDARQMAAILVTEDLYLVMSMTDPSLIREDELPLTMPVHPYDLLPLFKGGTGSKEDQKMRQALLMGKKKRAEEKSRMIEEGTPLPEESEKQEELLNNLLSAHGTAVFQDRRPSRIAEETEESASEENDDNNQADNADDESAPPIPAIDLRIPEVHMNHLVSNMNDQSLVSTGLDKLFLPLDLNGICLSKSISQTNWELSNEQLSFDIDNVSYFDGSVRVWGAVRWRYSSDDWLKRTQRIRMTFPLSMLFPVFPPDPLQDKVVTFDRPFDFYLYDSLRNVVYCQGSFFGEKPPTSADSALSSSSTEPTALTSTAQL